MLKIKEEISPTKIDFNKLEVGDLFTRNESNQICMKVNFTIKDERVWFIRLQGDACGCFIPEVYRVIPKGVTFEVC